MSQLIDWTFFVRNINIPNIDPAKPSNAANYQKLTLFIQKYEKECLLGILGYNLYKIINTESSSRVNDIINGVEYTDYYGSLQKWQGLVHDTNLSLIANYIYYYFMESTATQVSGVNTQVSKGEASEAVSPAQRMLHSWEFFSEESQSLIYFLWNKNRVLSTRVYPEFTNYNLAYSQEFSRSNISPF